MAFPLILPFLPTVYSPLFYLYLNFGLVNLKKEKNRDQENALLEEARQANSAACEELLSKKYELFTAIGKLNNLKYRVYHPHFRRIANILDTELKNPNDPVVASLTKTKDILTDELTEQPIKSINAMIDRVLSPISSAPDADKAQVATECINAALEYLQRIEKDRFILSETLEQSDFLYPKEKDGEDPHSAELIERRTKWAQAVQVVVEQPLIDDEAKPYPELGKVCQKCIDIVQELKEAP